MNSIQLKSIMDLPVDTIVPIFYLSVDPDDNAPLALPLVNTVFFRVLKPLTDHFNLEILCPKLKIVDANRIRRYVCNMRDDLRPERDGLPRLMDNRDLWCYKEPSINKLAVINFYRKHSRNKMTLYTIFGGNSYAFLKDLTSLFSRKVSFSNVTFGLEEGHPDKPDMLSSIRRYGGMADIALQRHTQAFENLMDVSLAQTYRVMIIFKEHCNDPCKGCDNPTVLEMLATHVYSCMFESGLHYIKTSTSTHLSGASLYVVSSGGHPSSSGLRITELTPGKQLKGDNILCKVLGGEERPESKPNSSCTLF